MKQVIWAIKELSPRWKVFGGIGIAFILFAIITASSLATDHWTSRKFDNERTARNVQIWTAEEKAKEFGIAAEKFKAQNLLLKIQNEAQSEILKANDKQLEGDANKLTAILAQRKKQNEEISNSSDDADYQLRQLCGDIKSTGFKLNICSGRENDP